MLKQSMQILVALWLMMCGTIGHAADPIDCIMSQDYQNARDLELNKASKYLQQHRAAQTTNDRVFFWRKPAPVDAILFDVDETLLSNWPEIKQTKCMYDPASWNDWLNRASAEAIPASIKLLKLAQQQDYAIVLMTGRPERYRQATIDNLTAAGITGWNKLIMKKGDEKKLTPCKYKAKNRALMEKNYRIIMNIGDQLSDFCGSNNGIIIKLPNPFYTIPTLADRTDTPSKSKNQ